MLLPVIGFLKNRGVPLIGMVALLGIAADGTAQSAPPTGPPIPNETGVIALEGTTKTFYGDLNKIIVSSEDGVEHLFHFTKRTVVHGATESDAAFNGLIKGSRVVVHYTVDGGEKTAVEVDQIGSDGLHEMRGVVRHVDRGAKRLSIRLADGTEETLELSERAAKDAGRDVGDAATVVLYYSNEAGHKVAHYFRLI